MSPSLKETITSNQLFLTLYPSLFIAYQDVFPLLCSTSHRHLLRKYLWYRVTPAHLPFSPQSILQGLSFPELHWNWSHPCLLWPTLCRYRLYLLLIWRILNFESAGCNCIFVLCTHFAFGFCHCLSLLSDHLTSWHSRFRFCDAR